MSPKKIAKLRMETRADKYVVGYVTTKNLAFGKKRSNNAIGTAAVPMVLSEARRTMARMPCAGAVLFKLVPVEADARIRKPRSRLR
jgi:hypothetical protein